MNLPAVSDCLTVVLVDRFDGSFSPIEQRTDSGTRRLAGGIRLLLSGQVLLSFILWHYLSPLCKVRGAAVAGHDSPVGCDVVASSESHLRPACLLDAMVVEVGKLIVLIEPAAHEELDATRTRNLR